MGIPCVGSRGGFLGGIRGWLFAGVDDDLDSAVLLPPFRIVGTVGFGVWRDRAFAAEALDPGCGLLGKVLFDQPGPDCFGTALAQVLVVGVGADGVGVAFDDDGMFACLLDQGPKCRQGLLGVGAEDRLVKVEERVGSHHEAPLAGCRVDGTNRLNALRHLDRAGLLPVSLRLLNLSGLLDLAVLRNSGERGRKEQEYDSHSRRLTSGRAGKQRFFGVQLGRSPMLIWRELRSPKFNAPFINLTYLCGYNCPMPDSHSTFRRSRSIGLRSPMANVILIGHAY